MKACRLTQVLIAIASSPQLLFLSFFLAPMAFAQAKSQPPLTPLRITPDPDESAVSKLLNWLVDVGINGFGFLPSAQDVAEKYLAKSNSREDAINAIINRRCFQAAGTGFVTGLGGMAVLPLALPASLATSYALAANSIAAIAYLRGYDIDSGRVRSMVLLCLLGRSAERVLKTAGVQVTKKLTQQAVKAIPNRVLVEVNRRVGFAGVQPQSIHRLKNLRPSPFDVAVESLQQTERFRLFDHVPRDMVGSEGEITMTGGRDQHLSLPELGDPKRSGRLLPQRQPSAISIDGAPRDVPSGGLRRGFVRPRSDDEEELKNERPPDSGHQAAHAKASPTNTIFVAWSAHAARMIRCEVGRHSNLIIEPTRPAQNPQLIFDVRLGRGV